MANRLTKISPSHYYYWMKCPKVAYYYVNKKKGFPFGADARLGTIIHFLYEKYSGKGLNRNEFENIWNAKIESENDKLIGNSELLKFHPIQWSSTYYSFKKNLILKDLIYNKNDVKTKESNLKLENEFNAEDDLIKGKIDRIIRNNNKVISVIDFKTGKIFKTNNKKQIINEVYQFQMKLYALYYYKIQNEIPNLIIKDLKGNCFYIKTSKQELKKIETDAINLRKLINDKIDNKQISELASCDHDVCSTCNYRYLCNEFKEKFLNVPNQDRIDLFGTLKLENSLYIVETDKKDYVLKNIKFPIQNYINKELYLYDLFYPNKDDIFVYFTINTIIKTN